LIFNEKTILGWDNKNDPKQDLSENINDLEKYRLRLLTRKFWWRSWDQCWFWMKTLIANPIC
jgi:hypothetical protein